MLMAASEIGRRTVLAAGAAFLARPVLAQAPDARVRVLIQTAQGSILVNLETGKAPITAGNFLRYVDAGRYDGASFYRATHAVGAPTVGLIEGGIDDPRKLFPPIAHESTLQTGLAHKDGTLSMAREAPGSAASDFFICSGPTSYLDANPAAPGDNAGYAAFGAVIEGMDVARAILALPTDAPARNPAMQGQMLSPPVSILSMKRVT
jgi:peptidyl-prolyl cis-trans isomerase A (cyclophilin A)